MMALLRTLLAGALMMAASICQAADAGNMREMTGVTFGNVNPAVPKEWTKRIGANGIIIFGCMEQTCADRGDIAYAATIETRDIEASLRSARETGTSLRDMGDGLSVSGRWTFKQIDFTDYTDSKQVKFQRIYLTSDDKDTLYYIIDRTVHGPMTRMVSARAPTLEKAKTYLEIALKAVK